MKLHFQNLWSWPASFLDKNRVCRKDQWRQSCTGLGEDGKASEGWLILWKGIHLPCFQKQGIKMLLWQLHCRLQHSQSPPGAASCETHSVKHTSLMPTLKSCQGGPWLMLGVQRTCLWTACWARGWHYWWRAHGRWLARCLCSSLESPWQHIVPGERAAGH